MKRILIDTDVILDFFYNREPFADAAAKILARCERKLHQGYITPVICSNLYYILRRNAPHEKVIEKLSTLLTIIHILSIDQEVVLRALHSKFSDFEGALQHFSATNDGKVDFIITRNLKDYKHSDVAVTTPEDFLNQTGIASDEG